MGQWQFIDEAAGQLAGPAAIDLPVGHEADPGLLVGPGDADIGQAALFLEALGALVVHAALAGEDAFLPAGQEDQRELQPLGRVQGHDLHGVVAGAAVEVHDQGDVLHIGLQRVEGAHRLDQFLEVLQPRLAGRTLVEAQGVGIATFLEYGLEQALMVGPGAIKLPSVRRPVELPAAHVAMPWVLEPSPEMAAKLEETGVARHGSDVLAAGSVAGGASARRAARSNCFASG